VPIGILTLLFGTYCLATSLRLIITISHITGEDLAQGLGMSQDPGDDVGLMK
jgi:hypothetical protein